jgi:hypothetical protein
MTTSKKLGMPTQNSSNRKERGFFGPWKLASKRDLADALPAAN